MATTKNKIDFKAIALKPVAHAAGLFGGEFLDDFLAKPNDAGQPRLNPEMRGGPMAAVGYLAPPLLGVKDENVIAAADAFAITGIRTLGAKYMPKLINGTEPTVAGAQVGYNSIEEYPDNSVAGVYAVAGVIASQEEPTVAGQEEPTVAGTPTTL